MTKKEDIRKNIAMVAIIVLMIFLLYYSIPFLDAFFGALILFVLARPVFKFLVAKKIPKKLSALIIIILSLIIIILPISIALSSAVSEAVGMLKYKDQAVGWISDIDSKISFLGLEQTASDLISSAGNYIKNMLLDTIQGISLLFINLVIMYFLLYYLLISHNKVEEKIIDIIPFNKKNSYRLFDEFKNVTYSTVISTGLLAILQATLMSFGFLYFGIPGAFLWGVIGLIFSMLPVVGISLIWIPAGLIYLVQQNYYVAIGIIIWGSVVSLLDNFIRPYLQESTGSIHPLITLIGVFMGISVFGLLGIVIGPLILSYFILMIEMYKEEYIGN